MKSRCIAHCHCGKEIPDEQYLEKEILGKMCAVNQKLFGHSATNDTGAAIAVFFRDRHLGAVGRGNARGPDPAGAGADYKQVKIVGHRQSSK